MSDEQDKSNAPGASVLDSTRILRYSTNKAGMDGLDKETITQIILENSKGRKVVTIYFVECLPGDDWSLNRLKCSKFYENELRKERLLQQQISQKLDQIRSLTEDVIRSGELEADKVLEQFERRRCFMRCIIHVDMDAFYAAVEIRDQPDLRFLPVAVGSNSMLSTSNYIARRFGVRAGLPGFLGKKLCPDLHIIPPDFARYTEASRAVRAVLSQYAVIPSENETDPGQDEDSPQVAMVTASLDEAYLDLTLHLAERQSWPEERRSYWPRPAPGAKMLVCRCSQRRDKKPHSARTHSSTRSTNSRKSMDESPSSEAHGGSTNTLADDDQPQNNRSKKPVDPELAVCDQCGYLVQSGRRVFGTSAWEAVREIRFRVFCATLLTCSAGIGPNTLIAKIASDWSKPMGQFEVPRSREAVNEFMAQMPVRKVPGIGHVSERRLDAFGIHTCGELLEKRGTLWHVTTRSAMSYYLRIASGHSEDDWLPCSDPTLVPLLPKSDGHTSVLNDGDSNSGRPELGRKSMSVERTFADCSDPKELFEKCRQLATMLSGDLKEEHVKLLREEMANERSRHHVPMASTSQHQTSDIKSNKPLTLRLMGLRMASLMPAEMCPQTRQRSIEEALTKVVATQEPKQCTNESTQAKDSLPMKAEFFSLRTSTPTAAPSTRTKIRQIVPKIKRKTTRGSRQTGSLLKQRTRQRVQLINPHVRNNSPNPIADRPQPSGESLKWCVTTREGSSSVIDRGQSVGAPVPIDSTVSASPTTMPLCISCPVCEKQWHVQSETEFNHHLDACLSRETIAEVVRETLTSTSDGSRSSSEGHTSSNSRKRPSLSTPTRSQFGSAFT
ncbi:putative rab geranylgeranyl transferase alpha subunit [Fasciolopsis buskii]|uniref:DNA polymerase kappa n=1 Tax=Fasciolopsis buskii TaxID=27845 RepID=A0A8E0VEM7_9TREM|nr:putative rab geranylgeranyl transferase alpha subunit [Fasciolopsis buski]